MARTKRRTRYSDANGNVFDRYREPWDRQRIEAATQAGIPARWLEIEGADLPAGSPQWEAAGDLLGCWTDLIYQLSDCLRGEDHRAQPLRQNMSRTEKALVKMYELATLQGIDPGVPGLIPWDVLTSRRDMYFRLGWRMPEAYSAAAREAIDAGAAKAAAVWDAVLVDGWGHPSGPGHDKHGHGLSQGTWHCQKESE